jgi:hypothetical protein
MKLLIILFLAAISCTSKAPIAATTPTPTLAPTPSVSPSPSVRGVKLSPVFDYTTKAERDVIAKVENKMNEVVQSKCFDDFLSKRKMIQTGGKTSQQVVDHVRGLSGSVPVQMYYRCMSRSIRCLAPTSAVAYRQPPDLDIHFNRAAFYPGLPLCEWVSTAAHEALGHSLGEYDHDFNWNAQRDFSVPYSLNAAVEACCHE